MSKCATCGHKKIFPEKNGAYCELARVLPHPLVSGETLIYSPCVDAETSMHFYKKHMILQAAVMKNGKIYPGRRHHNCIHDAIKDGCETPITSAEQGFVTDAGEFVTRIEAAKIAIECGQIKNLKWPPLLYSEDLY